MREMRMQGTPLELLLTVQVESAKSEMFLCRNLASYPRIWNPTSLQNVELERYMNKMRSCETRFMGPGTYHFYVANAGGRLN
jgi:hypothetical protein